MCDNVYQMSGTSLAEHEYQFLVHQSGVCGLVVGLGSEAKWLLSLNSVFPTCWLCDFKGSYLISLALSFPFRQMGAVILFNI